MVTWYLRHNFTIFQRSDWLTQQKSGARSSSNTTEIPRPNTPEQDDGLTDTSVASSEADAADDSDFVPHSDNEDSVICCVFAIYHARRSRFRKMRRTTHRTTSADSPLTDSTPAMFYYDQLDNRSVSAGVNVPQCFRDANCSLFHGDLGRIRKIPVWIPETLRTRQVLVTKAEELSKIDAFMKWVIFIRFLLCLECSDWWWSWSSQCCGMPVHKKASGIWHPQECASNFFLKYSS